jgi:DNA-binding MarR family transcriptional regulator
MTMTKALRKIDDLPASPANDVVEDPMMLADALQTACWQVIRRMRPLERLEGVNAHALWVLTIIADKPGVTPSAVAAAEQVSLPTVSRSLKELDEAELIERRPDPNDRRTQRLYATALGMRRLKDGRRRRLSRLAMALQKLKPKERAQLARAAELLRALRD